MVEGDRGFGEARSSQGLEASSAIGRRGPPPQAVARGWEDDFNTGCGYEAEVPRDDPAGCHPEAGVWPTQRGCHPRAGVWPRDLLVNGSGGTRRKSRSLAAPRSRSGRSLGMTQWGLSSRGRGMAEGSACRRLRRDRRKSRSLAAPRWARPFAPLAGAGRTGAGAKGAARDDTMGAVIPRPVFGRGICL